MSNNATELLVLVAGPYRSGTGDDPAKLAANVAGMNAAALDVFRAGDLPGTGEAPNCPVFIDGEHFTTLRGTYDELAEGFRTLVDNYVATRYSARP